MEQLLGSQLSGRNGSVPTSSLSAKYKLIYFSAHWCPPCKMFTPQLALFYNTVNAQEKQVEIIFVSYDRSESQFNEYFAGMPWLAVPYNDRGKAEALGNRFGVQGIPSLVLIDNNGNMKSKDGRNDVMSKGPAALSTWDAALRS